MLTSPLMARLPITASVKYELNKVYLKLYSKLFIERLGEIVSARRCGLSRVWSIPHTGPNYGPEIDAAATDAMQLSKSHRCRSAPTGHPKKLYSSSCGFSGKPQ